jgi:hypothetical protein
MLVYGSWLMADGSWFMVYGWLVREKYDNTKISSLRTQSKPEKKE